MQSGKSEEGKPPPTFGTSFDVAPYIVLWELTRACALNCKHCRASAIRQRDSAELSFEECKRVMDQLKDFGKPIIVFTGGDPVWRPDLFKLVYEANQRGFITAITPSATPRTTRSVIRELKESGIARLAVSLDGPDKESHDSFRRVNGSFQWTSDIINWASEFELPLQINSTIWKGNLQLFEKLAQRAEEFGAVLWSAFFLVPTGRAVLDMQISDVQAEDVLLRMAELCVNAKYDVKATAAPHFRRVLLQHLLSDNDTREINSLRPSLRVGALRSYQSVNDGKGIMFISHTGDVYPSGFLPIGCGNVKNESPVEIYRHNPLFKSLRNPDLLRGKCGICRFKKVCGGSRARAYAETGDHLAEDSLCAYWEQASA
ncbi:MAG: TIGR04053 family radical SAM/SPASM domain-containing protein [Candidatus Melainabacteria bacterium]|nr:TIGR04053 family radical SAM/SPASM domain-containing protein [Candidatus Melainabacteria bacterium]